MQILIEILRICININYPKLRVLSRPILKKNGIRKSGKKRENNGGILLKAYTFIVVEMTEVSLML